MLTSYLFSMNYYHQFYFQQCQKESGSKLSLKDLIVRPIQRIPRYELLIQVHIGVLSHINKGQILIQVHIVVLRDRENIIHC